MNTENGRAKAASLAPANAYPYDSDTTVTGTTVGRERAAEIEALLALSDERDRWAARLLAEWKQAYQAGYADAVRDAEQRANAEWRPRVLPTAEGPTHAELDRRRYPPDGRASWVAADDAFTAHPLSGAA